MEATIVCVDNSEWMRNGDFSPDRFQAQAEAVNLLAGSKMQEHPENGVGVLTMAGKAPQVLVTPTSDLSKVLNCVAELAIDGEASSISVSVQVAQLALKHRSNKNQRQRIVLFNGSPIAEDKDTLLNIAKKLKKNNVAVDIVCLGSGDESVEKLQAFIGAVDNNENCHFVDVPPVPILADALMRTPIFQGENAQAFGAGPSMTGEGEFNVDPNIDPELALALRISMEEERERLSRAAAAAAGEGSSAPMETTPVDPATTEQLPADVDESLLEAIAMSMQQDETADPTTEKEAKKTGDEIEREELEAALKMSLEAQHGSSDSMITPELVNSVLAALPGVDPSYPGIREAIEQFAKAPDSVSNVPNTDPNPNPETESGEAVRKSTDPCHKKDESSKEDDPSEKDNHPPESSGTS